ncbi:MAG: 6-bladed beta-propeller [Gemmatimonadaceae bacterium]
MGRSPTLSGPDGRVAISQVAAQATTQRLRPVAVLRLGALAALLTFACGAVAQGQDRSTVRAIGVPPVIPRVWPAPPEQPRISLTSTIASDLDLKRESGAFSGLRRLIAGTTTVAYPVLRPHDVTVDSRGRLYVSCCVPTVVRVFDPALSESRTLGTSGDWRLSKPMGLAVDEQDNVYVADQGTRRVMVYSPTGAFVRMYDGGGVFLNPVDVAVDAAAGLLYVVDAFRHQVLVLNRVNGQVLRRIGRTAGDAERPRAAAGTALTASHGAAPRDTAGTSTPPGHGRPTVPRDIEKNRGTEASAFRFPAFATVSPRGLLFVSDGLNARVQVFSRDGRFMREIGRRGDGPGAFSRPKGVALDSEDHLYVVDAAFSNVQLFDDQGRMLMAFAAGGQGPGDLLMPSGIASDRHDRLFVADRMNDRVQVYTYLGALAPAKAPPEAARK